MFAISHLGSQRAIDPQFTVCTCTSQNVKLLLNRGNLSAGPVAQLSCPGKYIFLSRMFKQIKGNNTSVGLHRRACLKSGSH